MGRWRAAPHSAAPAACLLLLLAVALRTSAGAAVGQDASSLVAGLDSVASKARAASLLAGGPSPLRLRPEPTSDDQACTPAEALRATFPAWALPGGGPQLSLLVSLDSCGAPGALLGFGAVDVLLDCSQRTLTLDGTSAGLGSAAYPLPPASSLTLLLVQDRSTQSFSVCSNGQTLTAAGMSSVALLAHLRSNASLLGNEVSLGARSDSTKTAEANLWAAWVADAALPCSAGMAAATTRLLGLAAANRPPALAEPERTPGGDVSVGDQLLIRASAVDPDGDVVTLHATAFGLPAPDCAAGECADTAAAASGRGAVELSLALAFSRPGRFVVRVEAANGGGGIVAADHVVLVRKRGDGARAAPCCRHSPGVVAQQLGRPIHETVFRDESVFRHAATLGWGTEYMQTVDLDAERLFDFSVLAPPLAATPLQLVTCQDSRLAGAGSPVLYGLTRASHAATHGRNKRLAVVPGGFGWAASPSQLACQAHWSGWQAASPRRLAGADGAPCSSTCTKAGTELLMRETGWFAQYNEALIAASYGQLSLNPQVAVLPEIDIPFESAARDNFSYYEAPVKAALAASGVDYWAYLALIPLATHRVPAYRAWSSGMASRGAVVTQCYPTYYYAVHETGHVLGFHHPSLVAAGGPAGAAALADAPADPLGAGALTAAGYSDALDIMACCRSDYSLYHRTMAGWLKGGERVSLGAADLAAPSARAFQLWPFDRPESRGRLMAVSVRRSAGEALLIGLRTASHWQDVAVAPNGASGDLAYEQMRGNVVGLSVEYVWRSSAGRWGDKGMLDFNVLHRDWPHALPATAGGGPRLSQFALLKEGTSWYDPASRLLLSLEAVGTCPGAGLRPWNHSALGFMGFRGEWPGQEFYERADYRGFASLSCARVAIRTHAEPPRGGMRISLRPASAVAADGSSMKTGAGGDASLAAASMRRRLQQLRPGACGAGGWVRVAAEPGWELASVVWRDNRNLTFASGPGVFAVALPPLAPLAEWGGGAAASPACAAGSCLAVAARYSVRVLAADGSHSAAFFSFGGGAMRVTYRAYSQDAVETWEESVPVGADWGGCGTSAVEGTAGATRAAESAAPPPASHSRLAALCLVLLACLLTL